MSGFVHQVEMKIGTAEAPERLRRIDVWCGDWQIGFRVLDTTEPGIVRLAFEDRRLAWAFINHFGGVLAPQLEGESALAGDQADAYDRLACQPEDRRKPTWT